MQLHFIAIGGSIMHSLALSLQGSGYEVSGSDDAIHEPARSRLSAAGLLPPAEGWFPERLSAEIDAVILGMHAKADNPELLAAQEKGLAIYSFPAFLQYLMGDAQQVVVAGSHGKTTITSMLMTVLKDQAIPFDHLVGARVKGFHNPVQFGSGGALAVLEGDEYPASCLDPSPKFLYYQPDILLLSGIAWDHINAFPTFEAYLKAFYHLLDGLADHTPVVYDQDDPYLPGVLEVYQNRIRPIPYRMPDWRVAGGTLIVQDVGDEYPVQFSGTHNLRNLEGAITVAALMGISRSASLTALQNFEGAEKRLQGVYETQQEAIYRDFAHAPSKVKATLNGLKAHYPDRQLMAILELHTYSSLTREFLPAYQGTMEAADQAVVFINPEALAAKGAGSLEAEEIREAFGHPSGMHVFFDQDQLLAYTEQLAWAGANVVLMSSGTFQGADLANRLMRQPRG
jgi:UDP-N-acetylmuramate: L-alanyl-gamma-D-glutamyl-meso-diaminopimelate ligase